MRIELVEDSKLGSNYKHPSYIFGWNPIVQDANKEVASNNGALVLLALSFSKKLLVG